jgi:hypothetical protein
METQRVVYCSIGLQYLVVFLGIAWCMVESACDSALEYRLNQGIVPSVLSISIAAYRSRAETGKHDIEARWVSIGLIAYAILFLWADPLGEVEREPLPALIRAAMVVLPLFGFKPLVHSRAWLAVWGLILLESAFVACLLSNGSIDFGHRALAPPSARFSR